MPADTSETAYTSWLQQPPAGTSIDERVELGRAARKKLPRSAIANWAPPADRPRATELLLSQEESRIPALVPVRHARMSQSALAFYRGGAIVMASDLGRTVNSGLEVMLCGDAHLSNFGIFGSAEHNVVFDVNDFDETAPGPFEWDVMRLVASFVLTAEDQGLGSSLGAKAAEAAAQAYQSRMTVAARTSLLGNWYAMFTTEQIVEFAQSKGGNKMASKTQRRVDKNLGKVKSRDAWSAVRKLTEVGPDGKLRFLDQPPLLLRMPADVMKVNYRDMFDTFLATLGADKAALLSQFEILDVAHKVVGVGSVGLPAIAMLLSGPDPDDLLVMQFKAAQASVLEQWTRPAPFDQHGERVVTGQRFMQASGDPFLGWLHAATRNVDLYGRQLRDFKWSVDLVGISATQLTRYAELCGATLAMAHARTGDPAAISAYLGSGPKFAKAMSRFARTYSDLAKQDYADFVAATKESIEQSDPTALTEEDLAEYRIG